MLHSFVTRIALAIASVRESRGKLQCLPKERNLTPKLRGHRSFRLGVEPLESRLLLTRHGRIIIEKFTNPEDDPTIFNFATTGAGYADFNLADGEINDSGRLRSRRLYTVTELLPAGWELTIINCISRSGTSTIFTTTVPVVVPGIGVATIYLERRDVVTCSFINTKQVPPNVPITISGEKFLDVNNNGAKNDGEPGLPGWTIFLDNGNGVLNNSVVGMNGVCNATATEICTITDLSGAYSFPGLAAGTYQVREVLQANWMQTTPNPADIIATAGANMTDVDFGNLPLVPAALIIEDPCDPALTALLAIGTQGNDRINIDPSDDLLRVLNRLDDSTIAMLPIPTGRIIAYGLDGDDFLNVNNSLTLQAIEHGGNGNDILRGGGGPDVLVGGPGNDDIKGVFGNDLLIGGLDKDKLNGESEDDILIAGTTAFDAINSSLCDIMREWTRKDADYATRIGNLRGDTPGGLNGGVLLQAGLTVLDDAIDDILTGGTEADWFFARTIQMVADTVASDPLETVNEI